MYTDIYSETIARKFFKIKKKDSVHYATALKKIDQIIANPEHRYKDLHHDMNGMKRVHIGHFVLIFRINHKEKIIAFEDYDHHDNIYKN